MRVPVLAQKGARMPKLDDKTLNELKIQQARLHQRLWASDDTWDELLATYRRCVAILLDRGRLQPLAKRYEKNPIRFCEKIMGRGWFEPPKETSPLKIQTILRISPAITEFLAAPHNVDDSTAREVIKTLRTLAARPAGRKRYESFAKAMALYQSGKNYHLICMKLIPAYKTMSPPERRAKRDAMRTGVRRLEKAMESARGQTKSS